MAVYQRVNPINIPLNHYKIPLNHCKSHGFHWFSIVVCERLHIFPRLTAKETGSTVVMGQQMPQRAATGSDGGFHKWGYPNSWMVYFKEKPYIKWMIWGYPYFRKPPYIYILCYSDILHICLHNRRKFRSQTSDNMERWKAEQGRGREKRKIRREKIRRERVRRQKIQMREKVGKSRNTVFFSNDLWLRRVEK